jgi:hypothetical protein
MLCGLQVAAFAVGVFFMFAAVVRLGGFELRRPGTFFVGVILFIQAPMVALSGFAAGASEGVKAAREGTEPDVRQVQKKWAWLDPAMTGGAIALAAVVGLASARPVASPEDLIPLEDPAVGVRDYVREQREREREDRERERARRQYDLE